MTKNKKLKVRKGQLWKTKNPYRGEHLYFRVKNKKGSAKWQVVVNKTTHTVSEKIILKDLMLITGNHERQEA